MSSLHLAWFDLKRLSRSRFLQIALLAVSFMPLLYAGLYLYAFWDPYGHLQDLPVALVNLDKGGVHDGVPENLGDKLVDKLKDNHAVKWEVVGAAAAEEGLKDGHYYLALYVPEDMTAKVLTASGEHPQKAELVYVANQGSNYLASSIGNRLMLEVKDQLSAEISGTFFTNTLVGLKDATAGLETAADAARQLAAGGTRALEGAGALRDGAAQLKAGADQLTVGAAAAADGAGKLSGGIAQASSKLTAAGEGAVQLDQGLASAARAGAEMAGGLQQLTDGANALAGGATQVSGGLNSLKDGLADPQKGIPALSGGAGRVGAGIDQLGQGVTGGLTQLQTGVDGSVKGLEGVQGLLAKYAAANPAAAADADFQQAMAVLSTVKGGLAGQVSPGMQQLNAAAQTGFAGLKAGQAQVSGGLTQLQTTTGGALTQLASGADGLKAGAGALQAGLARAGQGATQLSGGLTQLQAGAAQLSQGLSDPSGMNRLKAGADQLAGALTQLQAGSGRISQGLGDLQAGAGTLAGGLNELADGNRTLSGKLAEAATTMGKQAKGDAAERGQALAAPLELTEKPMNEVREYGTGLAPYFVPLSLWVGAMVLFFVIRTRENRIKLSLVPAPIAVLSKFWTLGVFGTVQATVTSFVLVTALHLHPQSAWQFYAFNIFLAWTFIAIMQLLVSLMGMVGRFAAMVIMMLQLTSCAGTFPVELLPGFFRAIAPYVPMTYATAGLRQIITGGSTLPLSTCVAVLAAFLAGALTLSMVTESRFVTVRALHPNTELAA